jgi:hypothetical protein
MPAVCPAISGWIGARTAIPGRAARFWSVEAAVEDGYSFRGVNRVGVRFALDTACRLGVSSD